jgi:hypothetical protein
MRRARFARRPVPSHGQSHQRVTKRDVITPRVQGLVAVGIPLDDLVERLAIAQMEGELRAIMATRSSTLRALILR